MRRILAVMAGSRPTACATFDISISGSRANAIVKPILIVLTFPFLIVTLGLFLLVLNGVMVWLTGAISDAADLGFHVSGFRAAFLGGLVVSVVSFLLSLMVGGDSRKKSER